MKNDKQRNSKHTKSKKGIYCIYTGRGYERIWLVAWRRDLKKRTKARTAGYIRWKDTSGKWPVG